MFARSADPTLITTQGTNISDAITTCMDNFPKNEEAQKVILLLTDGEDHDDQVKEASIKAKQQNIAIYTIESAPPKGIDTCQSPGYGRLQKR
ncbi:MAG: VWA domain-containing protein [Saprospiraceae bacterium]|nr:VWA domain-containing protein [Saprospiraceae bacterium]